jgi:hypothetical protein
MVSFGSTLNWTDASLLSQEYKEPKVRGRVTLPNFLQSYFTFPFVQATTIVLIHTKVSV